MMTRRSLIAGLGLTCAGGAASTAMAEIRSDIAPTGRLRAAINYGNILVAHRDASGEVAGLSVDLARELAGRLDLPLELLPFETSGKVIAAVGYGIWDIAFLAIDPVRANDIAFTAPFILVEGTYMVADGAPFRTIGDLDRPGAQIAVGRGSAYDLYLTRSLRDASLRRVPTLGDAIKLFVEQKLDAVAGIRQPLAAFARENPGYRLIEGRIMAVEQALCLPKGRAAAYRYVYDFVEEMKASGFIEAALARYKQGDAVLAPPAPRP